MKLKKPSDVLLKKQLNVRVSGYDGADMWLKAFDDMIGGFDAIRVRACSVASTLKSRRALKLDGFYMTRC